MDDQHKPPNEDSSVADWRRDDGFWFQPGDVPERPRRMRHGVYGNGRLANRRDLDELLRLRGEASVGGEEDDHGLCFPESTVLVEACPDGSQLAPVFDCDLCLPESLREKHVLLVGGTGAGKSTKAVLTQIASDIRDPRRTVIAIDAKGGVLYEFMVKLVQIYRPGQRVVQINNGRRSRSTCVWNPVSGIECRADALEMALAVCSAVDLGKQIKDPFWLNSSVNLLADVLWALALDPDPDLERSIAKAREIIDSYPYGMAEFADAHPPGSPYPQEGFPAILRALEGSNNVTQQSVVADTAQRLLMYGSEEITACTGGKNELDLRELISSAGILVLEVREADRDQLISLTNLFVSRVFTTIVRLATEQPDGRLPCPTSLILDELGSAMGELPSFETRLSTLRSRGVSITGAVQTLSQLSNLYGSGPAEAIVSNFNTRIFFGGGLGLKDAEYASALSGTMTGLATTTTDVDRDGVAVVSESHVPISRAVLLPEEIARPAAHPLLGPPATVFLPDQPPFYVYLTPAYQLPDTARAMAAKAKSPLAARPTQPVACMVPPPESAEAEIGRLKRELGWQAMNGPAKVWWAAQERQCHQQEELVGRLRSLRPCLDLYQHLERPHASFLNEFHDALQRSGTADFVANVAFFMWCLTVRLEHQREGRSL
ncbi:MAG TPA: type IV secretory system conjugative DNA transfer family protein [Pirellulales bacterium]|nr:type IV secretory system conjugative DNA transfer family protein [Pirellulales bacterium]